jgi:hypothetical protein
VYFNHNSVTVYEQQLLDAGRLLTKLSKPLGQLTLDCIVWNLLHFQRFSSWVNHSK